MATIDTSLFPSANVRFQMAEAPSSLDMGAIQQQKLANQTAAQNLATAKYNAQRAKLADAMRDVMMHETPEDTNAAIDRHVANGDMTPEQAADAKSKVPARNADGSINKEAMNAYKLSEFQHYFATNEQLYAQQLENERRKQISDIMGMGAAPAPAAPTNALAPTPTVAASTSQPAAPAAAPTTNALVSPPAQGVDVNALRNRINALYMMGEDKLAASLEDQLPKTPNETEFDKKWNLFKKQYPNGTYEQFVKLSQTPGTTVNLPPQELAESKAFGEQLVKDYSENIKPAADQARKSLNTVDVLQNLLDKGLQTGWGTELEGQARSALARMGVEGAKDLAGDIQTFKAFVRQNVLNEQMKQKGVQTEGDAQRIEETFARLGNTTESNRFLLDVRRAQLNRDIAQQKFWNDWKSKHGTFDGAENAWLEGEGSKSLFDAPTLKKYKPTEKPAAAPAGVKAMPTGAKLKTYADQHFNGDQVKAKAYLTSQGYK